MKNSNELIVTSDELKNKEETGNLLRIFLLFTFYFLLVAVFTGCTGLKEAREIKTAPMPPKYFETKEKERYASEGSLWMERASLYEDRKARRVNDLLTILITERSTASKKASTNTDRDSSGNYTVANALGMQVDNFPMLNDLNKGFKGSGTSKFKGNGDTTREGKLTATITAKVMEVLPNSNLVIESRKEVIVNNEKEIIVLRGIVRPDDILPNNTILSQNVADAQIYLVGDGVLDDKQSQGWLVRLLDKVWPF
ncbi:MAG: flagellar basal body L-ring protein FlgH [Nitrospirae bacterium]|nr:flagellar basal body L-ring protein FlgH [Nitrospirota bacterium]MCL5237208.1 flagellar basal body L-ring protein FlgH [Nitrospirota bacterium]